MSDFLRYPRNHPPMIEGCAHEKQRGNQFRQVDRRASDVREYLIDLSEHAATLTGTILIRAEAVGSPRGDGTWGGVSPTLFVRPEALPATHAAAS